MTPIYVYMALHKWVPAQGLPQSTAEVEYGGYKRVRIPRDKENWIIDSDSVRNRIEVVFPLCTGGEATLRGFSIAFGPEIDAPVVYSGNLSQIILIQNGCSPCFYQESIQLFNSFFR